MKIRYIVDGFTLAVLLGYGGVQAGTAFIPKTIHGHGSLLVMDKKMLVNESDLIGTGVVKEQLPSTKVEGRNVI